MFRVGHHEPEKLSTTLASKGGQDLLIVLIVVAIIVAVVSESIPITLVAVVVECAVLGAALMAMAQRAEHR